jgi:hypothetical protein
VGAAAAQNPAGLVTTQSAALNPPPLSPRPPLSPSITVRKSRYDLGKSFFTNITPGYQLYPTVYLLPWTDPSAPSERR